MNLESFVQQAFENVAAHISNLDPIRQLIHELVAESDSLDQFIHAIDLRMETAEITLRTDIRILVNELHRLALKESTR